MRHLASSVVFSIVVGLAAGGCGGPAKREKLQLGAVLSTTGDLAFIGNEQLEAANLAVTEINAAGGVLGKDLEITLKDDASDKVKAKAGAEALVTAKVPVILGSTGSGLTLEVAAVAAAGQVVQISGSSTSPSITTFADNGYLFRTCASDTGQGRVLAKRAKAKFTKVAVLFVPGPYGQGLADSFATAFVAAGGTVTLKKQYTETQTSYSALLTEAYLGNPEAIVLIAYPVDGSQIIKDYLSTFSTKGTFWFFTDGTYEPTFISGVGASNFTFQHEGSGPADPTGARWDTFKAAFKAKYTKDVSTGAFSVNVYDAVYLAALAMEAGGKADGPTVKDNLVAVSSGGTAYGPGDFKAAVADAKAKKDINFEGASGNVDLDTAGDVVAPYSIWKVSTGKFTTVEASISP